MLKLRNSNKYLYGARLTLKKYIRRNEFLLKGMLKIRERLIKFKGFPEDADGLFSKVFIETVSYCNNDCAFCSASKNKGFKKPDNFMPESLFSKIINELKELSFCGSVAFHCNNEPLLDGRLPGWIRIAREKLKNNFFYLYTNGTLINAKLAGDFFEAGLNRIVINNYSLKHELIEPINEFTKDFQGKRGEIIINYRRKTEYLGNRAGESPNAALVLKKSFDIVCIRPAKEIVIGYDGTVPLCCGDVLWKTVLGNVRGSCLKDIWFSQEFKRIRSALLRGDRTYSETCRICDVLDFPAPQGARG